MCCVRERDGERVRDEERETKRGESYQSSEGETKGEKLSREASILCRLRAEVDLGEVGEAGGEAAGVEELEGAA